MLPREGAPHRMTDLIDTTEMYLRTIYELIEDGVVPMRARIAEQLDHSGPTVSQTIARMERDGLVVVAPDRHLELTDQGRQVAVRVMRKHRLAERLLQDVIGLELTYVHDEACRWEHVMSERVERRVLQMLDGPLVSPYGNPIPGLGELGVEPSAAPSARAEMSLIDAVSAGISAFEITRLGESPQAAPDFLATALESGLVPGALVALEYDDDGVGVTTDQGALTIAAHAARHIFGTARLGESSRLGNMVEE